MAGRVRTWCRAMVAVAYSVCELGIGVGQRSADTVVTTPDEVTRYLAAHVPAPVRGAEPPVFIPTGLYVQSVEFSGPYTVEVSGHIWQRYANDLPKDLTKGVFLPEAKEQPTFKEVYHKQLNTEELTGWTFHATLRAQFDFARYPLGRHQIKLRMWHPDYNRNVYLTPDVAAYGSIYPAAVPGVDPNLVLEDWDIQQAFFSNRTHRYNTDFGTSGSVANQLHPELYYHRRQKKPGEPFYFTSDRAARDPGSALCRRDGAQQKS